MKDKRKRSQKPFGFSDLTPLVKIGEAKLSKEYEKAFLKADPKTENEFCRNTTTWD